MSKPLRILILEDNPDDAELMAQELQRAGFELDWERVESADEFRAHLDPPPDLILSDFNMPQLNALGALEILKEQDLDLPFVVVSGTIGEEMAVRCLMAGAHDYVLKDRMARLGQAVTRLLEETRLREEKTRVHEELRASEARYRNLFESSRDAIFATTMEGEFLTLNQAGMDLLGLAPEDMPRASALDFWMDPGDREEFKRMLVAHEAVVDQEVRLRKTDGTEMICLETASCMRDDNGEIVGYQGILRDITEKRRAEEALAMSEARFRDMTYSMADFVWETDSEGRYTFAAGRVKEILGYEEEEILGKTPVDLMPEEEAQRVRKVFLALSREKQPIDDLERWNLTKDGEPVCLLTNGVPVLGEDGQLLGYRGVDKDITEKKRIEEVMQEAERVDTVGRVMAGLAHDFKNILAVVQSTAETFRAELPEDQEELRADAEELQAAAMRGATLVRKLLSFGKGEELEPKPVLLPKVIRSFLSPLRRFLPEHIEIEVHDGEDLPPALVDPDAVEQILLNLASNARDAMPSGGTLRVSLSRQEGKGAPLSEGSDRPPGDYVCLEVRDTGSGMDEETRKRIFEAFFTTKGAQDGTGLGLSVVKRLVEAQGGFLEVESQPGLGSAFRVYLPVSQEEPESLADARGDEQSIPEGAGEMVLVVEDEPALRRSTRRTLERFGYTALEAPDGAEGLRMLAGEAAEARLVVTDVVMPNLGGPGLVRELWRQGISIDVLFTSGHSAGEIDELKGLGRDLPLIEKPWDVGEFARMVRTIIDGPRGSGVPKGG